MKVYEIRPDYKINKINNIEKSDMNPQKSEAAVQQTEIMNNSISESMGRSQVSFSGKKGRGLFSNPLFYESRAKRFGEQEQVTYNKEDGSFVRVIETKNGVRTEENFPAEKKEVITETNGYSTIVTTKTPYDTTVVESDELGEIYREVTDKHGNKDITRTERGIGRQVVIRIRDDEKTTRVIDLSTGFYVSKGPLTYDTTYNKSSDMYTTRNIVTGQVVKREQLDKDCKPIFTREYSEETGRVVRNYEYVYDDNCFYEDIYSDDGIQISSAKISPKGDKALTYTYAPDGEIVSIVSSKYDKDGNTIYEKKFNPRTKQKISEENFVTGEKTLYKYNSQTGRLAVSEYYRGDKLIQKASYYDDEKTAKAVRKYEESGFYSDTFYTEHGQKKAEKRYLFNGEMYYFQEFIPGKKYPKRVIDIDYATKNQTETFFDTDYGYKTREEVRTPDGVKLRETQFFENYDVPERERVFNRDGSYYETIYNERGIPVSSAAYSADNVRMSDEDFYSQRKKEQAQTTSQKQATSTSDETNLSTEKFMEKVLGRISSSVSSKSLTDEEWDKLTAFFGFEEKSQLLFIDKKAYKSLMRKYHPDMVKREEDRQLYNVVSKILNAFYEYSQATV